MVINLYAFSKKKNSTAQPTGTGTTLSSVQLKDETSLINPIIIINPATTGMPNPFVPGYFNYAYIPSFSRYYFISDTRWINGLWEMSLTVDVLASYRTGIGTLSEYVLRSSSSYNGSISDTLYPTKTGPYKTTSSFSLNFSNSGFYVVGIINNSSSTSDGCITYYMMTNAELGILKSYLMSETFLSTNGLSNLQEMSKDLVKAVFNPFQYIVSCRYFPSAYATGTADGTVVNTVEVGWWQIALSTKRMPSGYFINLQSNEVAVGTHPQAAARGDYLNHAPYTEHVLIHPLIGTISIDSNKIKGGQKIQITTRVDFTTGASEVYVSNKTESIVLYRTSIQCAVDVQLAQIAVDHLAVAQSAVNTVGNVVGSIAQFNVGGAIASAASGILNHLSASQPVMQTSGTNGNRTVYMISAFMYSYYRLLVDEDNTHRGRPLCMNKTINTLSGYIMCADAHAELNCLNQERESIVNFMNNGFYYE